METVVTTGPGGRILTHDNVWSPDSEWIAFDTRSTADGSTFDGKKINIVNIATQEVRTVYESRNDACCGVVTWKPHPNPTPKPDLKDWTVAFIHGPENPTPDWNYGPSRRQGVFTFLNKPGRCLPLDARNLTAPLVPGALRGGSHVHIFSPDGERVSFTYEDELLRDKLRTVAVATRAEQLGVIVNHGHPRNELGNYFSVVAARVTKSPTPGSDEISRACEEGWLGGSKRIAFQGSVVTKTGRTLAEVFVLDLPDDLKIADKEPLEGTLTTWPAPPKGTTQRRLTFTADRKYPGIIGPRHWLKSSPDGDRIATLMKDDDGIVQLFTVITKDGTLKQLTKSKQGIGSAFTWSRDGTFLAAVVDGRVSRIDAITGVVKPLSPHSIVGDEIRPEACVISPDGTRFAYVRRRDEVNQICVINAL